MTMFQDDYKINMDDRNEDIKLQRKPIMINILIVID